MTLDQLIDGLCILKTQSVTDRHHEPEWSIGGFGPCVMYVSGPHEAQVDEDIRLYLEGLGFSYCDQYDCWEVTP